MSQRLQCHIRGHNRIQVVLKPETELLPLVCKRGWSFKGTDLRQCGSKQVVVFHALHSYVLCSMSVFVLYPYNLFMFLKLSINVSVKLAYVFCLGTFKNIYTLLYIYRCTGILLNNTLSGRKQLALFVFSLFFHRLGEGYDRMGGGKSAALFVECSCTFTKTRKCAR